MKCSWTRDGKCVSNKHPCDCELPKASSSFLKKTVFLIVRQNLLCGVAFLHNFAIPDGNWKYKGGKKAASIKWGSCEEVFSCMMRIIKRKVCTMSWIGPRSKTRICIPCYISLLVGPGWALHVEPDSLCVSEENISFTVMICGLRPSNQINLWPLPVKTHSYDASRKKIQKVTSDAKWACMSANKLLL